MAEIRRADRPQGVLDNQNKFLSTGKPVAGQKWILRMFRVLRKMGRPEAADWRQIGGRLAADWHQIGGRLAPDWHQIGGIDVPPPFGSRMRQLLVSNP